MVIKSGGISIGLVGLGMIGGGVAKVLIEKVEMLAKQVDAPGDLPGFQVQSSRRIQKEGRNRQDYQQVLSSSCKKEGHQKRRFIGLGEENSWRDLVLPGADVYPFPEKILGII